MYIKRHALLLAIIALGWVLRLAQIAELALWLDEAFSIWLAWHPLRDILGWVVKIDQHPPLYYFLLHYWVSLTGDTAFAVRTLSAILGVATIPVVYRIGCCLADGDRVVGLLAALILALSPFHVHFAQEARMYTLLTLNVALATWALTRLLGDPQAAAAPLGWQLAGLRRCMSAGSSLKALKTDLAWLGYILFTGAALLSHNTAVFFPLATNIFVLGMLVLRRSPNGMHLPSWRNWLLAQAGVLLLWSPWMAAFISQSMSVYREFWIPPPTWYTVLNTIAAFLSDFLPYHLWFIFGAVFALLLVLGVIHFRSRRLHLVWLVTLFITPFVGELVVSLRRPIFYARTLIWASLPLYLLLAAGMRRLRLRPVLLAALCSVLVANGISLREYYVKFEKEQWDDAAAFVAERVVAGDVILFNATWVQIPFDYYFRTYNLQVAEHGVPVDLFDRGVLEPKMTEADLPRLRELIRGHDRVWLVYSHNWYTDPQGLIPATLDEELEFRGSWEFYGLRVYLYGRH
ncbi:MAG: glycosyltransferase family 39 protein [Anaerolineae bacterium]|nr:glycosyltransferase family 39 protein [Anaerolineae bacterium]